MLLPVITTTTTCVFSYVWRIDAIQLKIANPSCCVTYQPPPHYQVPPSVQSCLLSKKIQISHPVLLLFSRCYILSETVTRPVFGAFVINFKPCIASIFLALCCLTRSRRYMWFKLESFFQIVRIIAGPCWKRWKVMIYDETELWYWNFERKKKRSCDPSTHSHMLIILYIIQVTNKYL